MRNLCNVKVFLAGFPLQRPQVQYPGVNENVGYFSDCIKICLAAAAKPLYMEASLSPTGGHAISV